MRVVDLGVEVVEKIDLFTGKRLKLSKIELNDSFDVLDLSKRFSKSWESDISVVSSYMYDKNLVFGSQYNIKGDKITPVLDISDIDLESFEKNFFEIKKNNPEKYELSKRLFILCSQSVPEISLKRFGLAENIELKKLHSMFMQARIANMPVPKTFRGRRVSVWIKSILHSYLRSKNILIPTSEELRRGEETHSIKGALTFAPESGVHFNVVVVDFDSMYPSLIDSYNLSHETIDCDDKECEGNKVPGLTQHCVCTKRRGVYSILIGSLKDLRIHWFKPRSKNKALSEKERVLAEVTSKFLKLILVSSYGVVIRIEGISRSSLGEAITAYGRYSLRRAYEIAKEKGLHPIYGDTDSLFLENPSNSEVDWLVKTIKHKLKLDMSIEARYNLCVLPKAAKAYFGIKKDGSADIKGLTAIKSNSPVYVHKTFHSCIDELKNVEDKAEFDAAKSRIRKVVSKAISDLQQGKISLEDLEYKVAIHEDPKKKIKGVALHQPYQCAIQLLNLGRTVKRWDIMHFIKVKPFNYNSKRFTVKPTELLKSIHEINIEDYVRNLTTALNQTFKPMDISFSDQEQGKRTLLDFSKN